MITLRRICTVQIQQFQTRAKTMQIRAAPTWSHELPPPTHLPVGDERHISARSWKNTPDAAQQRTPHEVRSRGVYELPQILGTGNHVVVDEPNEVARCRQSNLRRFGPAVTETEREGGREGGTAAGGEATGSSQTTGRK